MSFYRVEDTEGRGPYRGMSDRSRLYMRDFRDNDTDRHPLITEEGFARAPGDVAWRFAFPSLDSLAHWFDAPRRARLEALGYVVREYEGKLEIATPRQGLFRSEGAVARGLVSWDSIPGVTGAKPEASL